MTNAFIRDVLDTLRGNMTIQGAVPNVENLYQEGLPYFECYESIFRAYERLRERLGVVDEDADIEIIINAFLDMEIIMAEKMFLYGAHFALDEHFRKEHPEYFR